MPAPESRKLVKTRHPGIFKRGGRYVVVYRDGRGRQRKEAARTLDDARRLQAKRKTQAGEGQLPEQTRMTFAEYARTWVRDYQGNGRTGFRELTRAEYRRDLERYAIPFLGRHRLTAITAGDIARFIGWLCDPKEQGRRAAEEERESKAAKRGVPVGTIAPMPVRPVQLSDRSVRRILAPVRSCLATAQRTDLIHHNPTARAALPRRDRIEEDGEDVRALRRDQLAMFLRVVDPRYRVFFELLAATGLRMSEIFGLQWRHLHLDGSDPHVKVRQALVRGHYGPPKSKHGRRSVPLDPSLVSALRKARAATEWPGEEDPVFAATNGQPLKQDYVRHNILKPAAEEAGAPWVGFHSFRHTAASLLFERGANAVQVQRWLGHHSPAFTLSRYVHLLRDSLGEPLDLTLELQPTSDAVVAAVLTEVEAG